MKRIIFPGMQFAVYADLSTDAVRPYIPDKHRYPLFRQLHDLSHSEIHSSQQMISHFIRERINKDVRRWKDLQQMTNYAMTRHTPLFLPPSPLLLRGGSTMCPLTWIRHWPSPKGTAKSLLASIISLACQRLPPWLADATTDSIENAFITTWRNATALLLFRSMLPSLVFSTIVEALCAWRLFAKHVLGRNEP